MYIPHYIGKRKRTIFNLFKKLYSSIPFYFFNGKSFPALSIKIILTYRCNLKCVHCFYYNELNQKETIKKIYESKNKELTLDEIKNLIDEFAKINVKNITFHGGEPLLRNDIFEMIAYATKKNLSTNIDTNGTLITEEVGKKLVDAGLKFIMISIEGPEEIHDSVRGKGIFQKALQGIKNIQEYKKIKNVKYPWINLSPTISSLNVEKLDEIVDIAADYGVDEIVFTVLTWNSKENIEKSRSILNKILNYNPQEAGSQYITDYIMDVNPEILLETKERIKQKSKLKNIRCYFPPYDIKNKIEQYHKNPKFSFIDKCVYPWHSSVISPTGYVYPCVAISLLNFNLGNIREKKFREIWNGKEYKDFRKALRKNKLLPVCYKCCELNPCPLLD